MFDKRVFSFRLARETGDLADNVRLPTVKNQPSPHGVVQVPRLEREREGVYLLTSPSLLSPQTST